MKKIISFFLCALLILSMCAMSACSGKAETLKLGLGVYTSTEDGTNANGEVKGKGQFTTTAAAVLLDADGKIVKCVIDTADFSAEYTSAGKYVAINDFKTKYELGDAYGMKAYGGAAKEWFEQVDALTSVATGKTLDEVKQLVTDKGYGNDDVVNAGCTITVSDFIYALEAAVKAATDSDATADSSLKLKITTSQSGKDATADAKGYNQLTANITVEALDADSKAVASRNDTADAKFSFDAAGAAK